MVLYQNKGLAIIFSRFFQQHIVGYFEVEIRYTQGIDLKKNYRRLSG